MQRIKWYRIAVDTAEMKSMQQRSDLRGLLQAGSQMLIVVLTGTLCFHAWNHWSWPAIIGAFFLHGTFFSFLTPAAAIHELSHGTPFKNKKLNEFFYWTFSFFTWTNGVYFRTSHMQHHQNTLHDVVDQEVELPAIYGWFDFLKAFTIAPAGCPKGLWIIGLFKMHLINAFGKLNDEWEHRLFDEAPKKRAKLFNWARFLWIGHIALTAWFIYIKQPILIPIVITPFYASWLAMLCGGTQHAGMQDNVDDFRRCCRTVTMGLFPRYCYWNMNYHIEHHMYAAVPFYNLPRLHKAMKHDCPVPSKSLCSAWKEIMATGKKQKTDPDYYFDSFSRT